MQDLLVQVAQEAPRQRFSHQHHLDVEQMQLHQYQHHDQVLLQQQLEELHQQQQQHEQMVFQDPRVEQEQHEQQQQVRHALPRRRLKQEQDQLQHSHCQQHQAWQDDTFGSAQGPLQVLPAHTQHTLSGAAADRQDSSTVAPSSNQQHSSNSSHSSGVVPVNGYGSSSCCQDAPVQAEAGQRQHLQLLTAHTNGRRGPRQRVRSTGDGNR